MPHINEAFIKEIIVRPIGLDPTELYMDSILSDLGYKEIHVVQLKQELMNNSSYEIPIRFNFDEIHLKSTVGEVIEIVAKRTNEA